MNSHNPRCTQAALECWAMFDNWDLNEPDRLAVIGALAAFAWRNVPQEEQGAALECWFNGDVLNGQIDPDA